MTIASRAWASPLRPRSSAARPSITVSTRLRKAARPATWAAAPGAGVIPSSSTTASTCEAGKAIRRPPRRAMRRSSAMAAALRCGAAQRADQGRAVVAIDAFVAGAGLGPRAQAHHLPGLDRRGGVRLLGQDQDVGGDPLAGRNDAVAEALGQ